MHGKCRRKGGNGTLRGAQVSGIVSLAWLLIRAAGQNAPIQGDLAKQLATLSRESAAQVANTSASLSQQAALEGQRQLDNLRKAADMALPPIVAGISEEAAALMHAAQMLGMPRLEEALTQGAIKAPNLTPDDDRRIIVDVYEPEPEPQNESASYSGFEGDAEEDPAEEDNSSEESRVEDKGEGSHKTSNKGTSEMHQDVSPASAPLPARSRTVIVYKPDPEPSNEPVSLAGSDDAGESDDTVDRNRTPLQTVSGVQDKGEASSEDRRKDKPRKQNDQAAPSPAPEAMPRSQGHKVSAAKKGKDGSAVSAAPGPSAPAQPDWDLPSFAGQPLSRTPVDIKIFKQQLKRKKELEQEQNKGGDGDKGGNANAREIPFPIYYLDQLRHLDDKEAFKIFHRGTAEIPSQVSSKQFAYCDKAITLPNSIEKPSAWPTISFPILDDLYDPISRAVWHGKFFATNNNQTQLWNLLFTPVNLQAIANVTNQPGGYSGDGRDSFIVDYSTTENFLGRVARDEMRRVGPTIFLGRGFIWLDIQDLIPKYANGFEKAILEAIEPLTNATQQALWNAQQLIHRIRNSSPYTDTNNLPVKAIPFSFYFAIDCQDYHIPSLHYSPLLMDSATNLNTVLGYDASYYALPRVPGEYLDASWDQSQSPLSGAKFQGYPEDGARSNSSSASPAAFDMNDPKSKLKFDKEKDEKSEKPYVLFPLAVPTNASLGLNESEGFVQMPASVLEPAFGSHWAGNFSRPAGWPSSLAGDASSGSDASANLSSSPTGGPSSSAGDRHSGSKGSANPPSRRTGSSSKRSLEKTSGSKS
eukprot:jgi/Botrbrau1/2534/Bobra.0079s0022.1